MLDADAAAEVPEGALPAAVVAMVLSDEGTVGAGLGWTMVAGRPPVLAPVPTGTTTGAVTSAVVTGAPRVCRLAEAVVLHGLVVAAAAGPVDADADAIADAVAPAVELVRY